MQKRTLAEEDAEKQSSISHFGDAGDCTSEEIYAPASAVVLECAFNVSADARWLLVWYGFSETFVNEVFRNH